jgi:hypothetical protein
MTTALPRVILRRRRPSARRAPDAMPRCDTGYCPNPTIWVPCRAIAVDCIYISPLPSGPSTLRPPSHQCLSRISPKLHPRTHPAHPEQANNSSTALASVSLTLPSPRPLAIYPPSPLARYRRLISKNIIAVISTFLSLPLPRKFIVCHLQGLTVPASAPVAAHGRQPCHRPLCVVMSDLHIMVGLSSPHSPSHRGHATWHHQD